MKTRTIILFLTALFMIGTFFCVKNAEAGCCVISSGNCKTVSTQQECTGAQAFDPDKDCSQHQDVCKGTEDTKTLEFPNPIAPNSANELLGTVLNSLRGVIAVIAIIFIVIGGIMYMASGGNEKMIDKAKATITGAVVGLAIAMAAPAFLKQILEVLGTSDESGALDKALTIKQIATNVLNFLLSITGIVAIIGLIVGGIFYLTAYGDEDRIDKGKKILTYSIIGILVASAALVIVKQVAALLGQ